MCFFSKTIEEQCVEVRKVKRFENGFILDPFCVSPSATLRELDMLKNRHGFSGCPVTDTGKMGGKVRRFLSLILTHRWCFLFNHTSPFSPRSLPVISPLSPRYLPVISHISRLVPTCHEPIVFRACVTPRLVCSAPPSSWGL